VNATTDEWTRLAEAIKAQRRARGFAKRAPFARHIQIDDSTMAIIEGARPGTVSDEMMDFVAEQLGWTPATWRAILRGATRDLGDGRPTDKSDVERALATQLNPKLRDFNDLDLLAEIQTRMLLMASRLGPSVLEWRIDPDGLPELVSRVTKG
jgi:hypothetical protein